MNPEIQLFEYVLFIGALILSGFYSGSEAALLSIPQDRVRQLINDGGRRGSALKFLAANQGSVLTTILVGNNLANIFAASFTTKIAHRFFQDDAVAFSVGITTLLILIFGEIIPKTFARSKAEKLAYPVIIILRLNYYLMFPVIYFFDHLIRLVLGKNAHIRGRLITKDDIEFMVNKAEQDKSIDSKQIDLLWSILEFPTIKVKDIMIPRNKVTFIQKRDSLGDIIDMIKDKGHSRYPVCNGDLDNTIGFLHVKDLAFISTNDKGKFKLDRFFKAPFFVYEHMKIQSVMDHMNRKKVHLALVKDENGLVVGIVTLEDIIEEIFGDIRDEHDNEELQKEVTDEELENGFIVEGSISLRDLYNESDIEIPLNDNYSTVTGFILDKLGNSFPKQGQVIIWENFSFELVKVEEMEIKKVKVKIIDTEKSKKSDSEEKVIGE
ncbi:MAG: HlyC/CorC family transporter [Bacteriovoracaceae bacterium]|nr:HlyC/CorC family transporter [Bacteriovoracaceae bacterium]